MSSRANYRSDIQGLRALAIGLVVLYHAGLPLTGGFIGVDVFFVISGFVITAMLMREWSSSGSIRLGQFYLKRVKRLGPALAVVLIATSLLAVFFLNPSGAAQRATDTAIGASFFVGNVVIGETTGGYFDSSSASNPLLHTWTLAIEEQFYIVFPVALLIALTLGLRWGRKHTALMVTSGASVVSFVLSVLGSAGYTPPIFGGWFLLGFYSPISRAWEFGVGAIIALIAPHLRPLSATVSAWLVGSGLAMILFTAFLIDESLMFPGPWALPPVLGTAIALVGGSSSNRWSNLLSRPIPRFLGNISYSWYLWHWPIIVSSLAIWPQQPAVAIAAALVSLIPATASYFFVENPVRKSALSTRRGIAALIILSVGLPAVLGAALGGFTRAVAADLNLDNRADWPGMLENCNRLPGDGENPSYEVFSEWANSCVWNEEATGPPVYLIGDSNAVHFSAPVIEASAHLDRPAYSITFPGCLPFEQLVSRDACESYTTLITRWLSERALPGTVMISTSDTYTYPGGSLELRSGDSVGPGGEAKAALYGELLSVLVAGLQTAGHDTVLVKAVPSFTRPEPEWDPGLCSAVEFATLQCTRDVPRDAADSLQNPQRLAIDQVARISSSPVVDVRERYCGKHICSPIREDTLAYVDATHLSSDEAQLLTPAFEQALNRLPKS